MLLVNDDDDDDDDDNDDDDVGISLVFCTILLRFAFFENIIFLCVWVCAW